MKKKTFNYIDLFAGAGGLSEGFSRNSFNAVAHVEMNADACASLKTRVCYHYLESKGQLGKYYAYLRREITRDQLYNLVPAEWLETVIHMTMSEENMPSLFSKIDDILTTKSIEKVDIVVGGPPCQAYSLVGRAVKSDKMVGDPRNYLYKLYCETLIRYSPEMFIFENVPGLLTANKGTYFADMKQTFDEAGYNLQYQILNASDFGVLQNRRRVILVGWKKESNHNYPHFKKVESTFTVSDILRDLPEMQAGETRNDYRTETINSYLSDYGIRKIQDILTWNVSRPHIERDREIYRIAIKLWNEKKSRLRYTDLAPELITHKNKSAFLDRFKVVASDLPVCHTMMAHISKDGHHFIHPDINQARSLTVREAARVQSFPDDFYFEGSRTAAFTQIGNAVPPLMASGIAAAILIELRGNKHGK